jgi:oligoribonuclease NrnB/cAMP/cGMP phosphodiesterase (DHH superfamily)
MNYGDALPETRRDDQVYFVDFSIPAKDLQELAMRVEYVTVIDHHKTAQADLQDFRMSNVTILFDMEECGSSLAWKYFFPRMPHPVIIDYIKAADIWKPGNLVSYPEITAYIRSWPQTTAQIQILAQELEDKFDTCILEGRSINRNNYQLVEEICKNAWFANIQGYEVPCLNTNVQQSLVGNRLCKIHPDKPFSATFFVKENNDRVYSLRSIGDFDVSEVAKKYPGGGGHKNAAGFTLKGFEI